MLSGNQLLSQAQTLHSPTSFRTTIHPNIDVTTFKQYQNKNSNLPSPKANNIYHPKQYKLPSQSFSSSALPVSTHTTSTDNCDDLERAARKNTYLKNQGSAEANNQKRSFFSKNQNSKNIKETKNQNQQKQHIEKKFFHASHNEPKKFEKINITVNEIDRKKNIQVRAKSPINFSIKNQFFQKKGKNVQRVSEVPFNSLKDDINKDKFYRKQNLQKKQITSKNELTDTKNVNDSFASSNKKLAKILHTQTSPHIKRTQNLSITPTKLRVPKSPANAQIKKQPIQTQTHTQTHTPLPFYQHSHHHVHLQSQPTTVSSKPSFFASKKSVSRFHIIRQLHKTKFCQAFLCVQKKSLTIYCLRRLKKSLISQTPDLMQHCLRKIHLRFVSSHPNIIQVYDIFSDHDFVYLVEEFMEGGNLKQYMQKQRSKPQSTDYSNQIKKQSSVVEKLYTLNSALHYIHTNEFIKNPSARQKLPPTIHSYLCPQNIELCLDSCKISPLNLRKVEKQQVLMNSYVSPEGISGQFLTHKSDLWSLGVVLFELLANRSLFKPQSKDCSLADQIVEMDFNKQISTLHFVSHSLKDMIRCLLKINPEQRISCNEILNSSLIKNYGFRSQQIEIKNKLEQMQVFKSKAPIKQQISSSKESFFATRFSKDATITRNLYHS